MVRKHCVAICFIIGIILTIVLSCLLSALDTSPSITDPNAWPRHHRSPKSWPRIGDRFNNIFWIVQVSDIHISIYRDLARTPDLERFCAEYITLIQPELVLLTGDLTDAKMKSGIESKQIRDEWVMYENVIKKCKTYYKKAQWLDLRGNHDSFDVFDYESKNNYYRLHSAREGVQNHDSEFQSGYIHYLEMPFGVYSFIGIDTCSQPGPNRPFNFFGYLEDKQIQHLQMLKSVSKSSNHTLWFGHFPTSLIVHDPPVLRQLMSNSIAYVCGHLHTLMDYVPRMYSRHKTGQLELELGDWKDHRIFRVIAFDHDLMSFADARLGQWPVIIITNPKSNQFLSPQTEPVEMIAPSTHIRILVFSPISVKTVTVYIDKHLEGFAHLVEKGKPLYALGWHPSLYMQGHHRIQVVVTDINGKNSSIQQYFALDGSERGLELLPRLILMLNIYSVGRLVFGILVFSYTLILTSVRQLTYIRQCYMRGQSWFPSMFNSWLMKIWLAARTNPSYYALVGSVLYLTFGPWFIGDLLSDKTGVVFVWGIIIDKNFLPGGLTYFYGIFQFMTFTVPLTMVLGHLLDMRRKHGNRMLYCHHLSIWLPALLLGLFTFYVAITEFPKAYGQRTILLGPLRTGSIILLPIAVLLAYRVDLKQILAVN